MVDVVLLAVIVITIVLIVQLKVVMEVIVLDALVVTLFTMQMIIYNIILQMEWIRTGNQSYSSVTRSGDGAVVTLQCGGYCGGCVPEHQIFLEINPQECKYV